MALLNPMKKNKECYFTIEILGILVGAVKNVDKM